jgi:hypothetical protein
MSKCNWCTPLSAARACAQGASATHNRDEAPEECPTCLRSGSGSKVSWWFTTCCGCPSCDECKVRKNQCDACGSTRIGWSGLPWSDQQVERGIYARKHANAAFVSLDLRVDLDARQLDDILEIEAALVNLASSESECATVRAKAMSVLAAAEADFGFTYYALWEEHREDMFHMEFVHEWFPQPLPPPVIVAPVAVAAPAVAVAPAVRRFAPSESLLALRRENRAKVAMQSMYAARSRGEAMASLHCY